MAADIALIEAEMFSMHTYILMGADGCRRWGRWLSMAVLE